MEEVEGAEAEVFGWRAGRNGDDGAVSGGVFAMGCGERVKYTTLAREPPICNGSA